MRYHEIIAEDAEKDLNYVVLAREIVRDFTAYIKQHELTPLRDIPGCVRDPARRCYYFAAHEICPNIAFKNLRIGFEWGEDRLARRACFTVMRYGMRDFGTVFLTCGDDPGDETRAVYYIDAEAMVHELIHFFDWRRFRRKEEWSKENERLDKAKKARPVTTDDLVLKQRDQVDQKRYFNSTKEMNAYFQQGAERIFDKMVKAAREREQLLVDDPEWANVYRVNYLQDFMVFMEKYAHKFDYRWRCALTPNNKRWFIKRLYKLFLLAQKQWPKMSAIKRDIFVLD